MAQILNVYYICFILQQHILTTGLFRPYLSVDKQHTHPRCHPICLKTALSLIGCAALGKLNKLSNHSFLTCKTGKKKKKTTKNMDRF